MEVINRVQIPEIFRGLLANNDRYYFLTGGRGSGKSFSVAWSILMLTFESNHVIYYTRLTMVSAKTSVIPEFKSMIEKMGMDDVFHITQNEIINKQSGSKIWFQGLKTSSSSNTARNKSLAGVTTWVVDEFEDMFNEEKLFDQIDNSIRTKDRQNRVIMVMNPATKEFWAYKRFFTDNNIHPKLSSWTGSSNDTTYIHTTWLDVAEHLDESWINKALRIKAKDPEKYEHVYLGGWLDKAEGVILKNWDYEDFDSINERTVYGLDFGYRDPMALVAVKVDKNGGKIYVKLLEYERELTETEMLARVIKHCGRDKIVADGARPESIEAIRRRGFNIVAADKSPGSVLKGLSLLTDHKILVHPDNRSHLVSREFNNYVWEDEGKKDYPKQNTDMDHCIDALRYAASNVLVGSFKNYDRRDFYF